MKRRIFELIDPSHTYENASRAFNIGMPVLTFLNPLVGVIATIDKVETAKANERIAEILARLRRGDNR